MSSICLHGFIFVLSSALTQTIFERQQDFLLPEVQTGLLPSSQRHLPVQRGAQFRPPPALVEPERVRVPATMAITSRALMNPPSTSIFSAHSTMASLVLILGHRIGVVPQSRLRRLMVIPMGLKAKMGAEGWYLESLRAVDPDSVKRAMARSSRSSAHRTHPIDPDIKQLRESFGRQFRSLAG